MPRPASVATTLSCQVIPGADPHVGNCGTFRANPTYIVDLAVANPFGSLTWSTPPGYSVVTGCTSGAKFCDLSARATRFDQTITVSVMTHNQLGAPVTLSARAFISAVCGAQLC